MPSTTRQAEMKSILQTCRQCGTCCQKFRKIPLQPEEVAYIEKMGGYVGTEVRLFELNSKSLDQLRREAIEKGKVYMIHPDNQGCVFLDKKDGKYFCRIYQKRPQICRGFMCNLADDSFLSLFGGDSIYLLGLNSYGQPLNP